VRVFLVSCLALVLIGLGAYAVLEGYLRENAGNRYSLSRSVRVDESAKPDPRGFLSFPEKPAGGITSGRSPAGAPPPPS
jgi:hypothetical protein